MRLFPVEVDGCLVAIVHNDSDVEDEGSFLLWRQLCSEVHVELQVRRLKSGYCKDVHGQLTITQRDENRTKHRTREVQFKILEKNVTFFAPRISKLSYEPKKKKKKFIAKWTTLQL
ncbi:PREDICTED: elongator complex protein 6-like [Acropora digitifera]|uniref:elongator complex protein 6-like n=1 Tax=Acropora digitifera TaxID=70779 RepID=UPI00077AF5D7|nr:PREDICTED: elongator complex protein 6-like [Acropora digitifera]